MKTRLAASPVAFKRVAFLMLFFASLLLWAGSRWLDSMSTQHLARHNDAGQARLSHSMTAGLVKQGKLPSASAIEAQLMHFMGNLDIREIAVTNPQGQVISMVRRAHADDEASPVFIHKYLVPPEGPNFVRRDDGDISRSWQALPEGQGWLSLAVHDNTRQLLNALGQQTLQVIVALGLIICLLNVVLMRKACAVMTAQNPDTPQKETQDEDVL